MNSKTTRRSFLQQAIATGGALTALEQIAAAAQDTAASQPAPAREEDDRTTTQPAEKTPYSDLRIAYIGVGGIGGYHLNETVKFGVQCPCYCDVDTNEFKEAVKHFPQARTYQDYREMLEKEQNNIDAVMIGTPDHHHYPATMIAMQLGKHVYTQKPLTHTPWEARQLTQMAQKNSKLATQMGNQGHAKEGWRLVYEWIKNGDLGDITEVHTWTDRPIWPQGMERPESEDAVPSNLNWDVWLGPAPVRPYKKGAYHRFAWRGWWDFGAGALGDMACHTMDGVFWALDPGHPLAVEPVASTPITADAFPKSSIVKWTFPAKGDRKPFDAYWYDGGLMPPFPTELETGRKLPSTGNLFMGTKASILVAGDYGDSPRIFPEAKMKQIGKPPQALERSPGHVLEWLMACVGEKPANFPKSNFAYAGPFSETVLLGNVALRVGRKLDWDGEKMEFTNLPEANQYVSKEYRSGWKLA